MKAIMLMFDSLNRHFLPNYGCDWTRTPNFKRLGERTVTFDTSYVCSMPCMPARRDLHTGRPNFLHTGWSPLQPWDDSVPEMLKLAGTSSHLITDHYHYLEDGGAGYHTRYSTWECFRGQEGDPWIGQVSPPRIPENINGKGRQQDWINRQFTQTESDFPQTKTFNAGLNFIDRNHSADNWFLQIETFDPHEPFCSSQKYQELFERAGEAPLFDWPAYDDVHQSTEEVERARHNYAALLAQCDANLGRLLDTMDQHELWEDTMLIVWTDHGYLLGEHQRWAKNIPTLWEEISHTPFFMWDPRYPETAGQRRNSLVQPSIDLGPTLLEYFNLAPTKDMTGKNLSTVVENDTPVREDAIFGHFGETVHYTNGNCVYMRAPVDLNTPLYSYNSMPVHMRHRWETSDWQSAELVPALPISKGMPVLRRPITQNKQKLKAHRLYDLKTDAQQNAPVTDPTLENDCQIRMRELMHEAHAPDEMFKRYGLSDSIDQV